MVIRNMPKHNNSRLAEKKNIKQNDYYLGRLSNNEYMQCVFISTSH